MFNPFGQFKNDCNMNKSAGPAVTGRLDSLVRALPKAELHLHLEGSISAERFRKLSRKYKTEFSGLSAAEIRRQLFSYSDFWSFLQTYRVVCEHLREPRDYVALVRDLGPYFESQNIRYAEVFMSPSIPARLGFDVGKITKAMTAAAQKLADELSIDIRWIFDCVRQFGPEAAQETAELAVQFREQGAVGLGLAGDETAVDSREFEDAFAFARAHELYVHVHAGEIGEPQNVWDAIKILGANRIGHGIQAARDHVLMSYLKDHAIGLDICLTSNARTGAWAPISKNPFWLLYKRGVPVTLSTDDPGLFDTTLLQEYALAIKYFELAEADLAYIALQSIRSAFLPHGERMKLMQEFQNSIHELTAEG